MGLPSLREIESKGNERRGTKLLGSSSSVRERERGGKAIRVIASGRGVTEREKRERAKHVLVVVIGGRGGDGLGGMGVVKNLTLAKCEREEESDRKAR